MTLHFELPEEFNVYSSHDTLEALKLLLSDPLIDKSEFIEISAHKVAEIDGTGMQLLAALSKAGYKWRIGDASEKFQNTCRSLGFGSWLTPTGSISLPKDAAA